MQKRVMQKHLSTECDAEACDAEVPISTECEAEACDAEAPKHRHHACACLQGCFLAEKKIVVR